MENKYIIAIGSNFDAKNNIKLVCNELKELFQVKFTRFIQTKPIDIQNKNYFINGLGIIYSEMSLNEITHFFKQTERKLGRSESNDNKEIIPIDIDVIVFNDTILKNDFKRTYVQELIEELY